MWCIGTRRRERWTRLEQQEAEDHIEARLDAVRSDLEAMGYEELLGEDHLEQLAGEEIDRRLESFEESHQE